MLARNFGAGLDDVHWVVTSYMLTQAAVVPIAPHLTRRLGPGRAYRWTLTAFLLGSLLCAAAWDLPSLVAFRIVQGVGGGVLLPMVMILILRAFPHSERGVAVSAMSTPVMVAPLLGPVLGGILVTHVGWQSAFLIDLPLGVVGLALARRTLAQGVPDPSARADVAGLALAALGSTSLLIATTAVGAGGLRVAVPSVAALALLTAFVRHQRRRARAGRAVLLRLALLRDRMFALGAATEVTMALAWFGMLLLVTVHLQDVRGMTAAAAGATQGALALAVIAVLPVGGWLSRRIGPWRTAMTGAVLLVVGSAALAVVARPTVPVGAVVAVLAVLGAASALRSQVQVVAMIDVHPEDVSGIDNATTIFSVLRAAAAPLGVGLLTAVASTGGSAGAADLNDGILLALQLATGLALAGTLTLRAARPAPEVSGESAEAHVVEPRAATPNPDTAEVAWSG